VCPRPNRVIRQRAQWCWPSRSRCRTTRCSTALGGQRTGSRGGAGLAAGGLSRARRTRRVGTSARTRANRRKIRADRRALAADLPLQEEPANQNNRPCSGGCSPGSGWRFTRERSQVRTPPRPSSESPVSAGFSSFRGRCRARPRTKSPAGCRGEDPPTTTHTHAVAPGRCEPGTRRFEATDVPRAAGAIDSRNALTRARKVLRPAQP
jgi:hypothetical protein